MALKTDCAFGCRACVGLFHCFNAPGRHTALFSLRLHRWDFSSAVSQDTLVFEWFLCLLNFPSKLFVGRIYR